MIIEGFVNPDGSSKGNWRVVLCAGDGCRCGGTHPAFIDCPYCHGSGVTLGGDELQPCLHCRDEAVRRAQV